MSGSETCCICGVRFVKGPKGYKRRRVKTLTSSETFKVVFDFTPNDSSFLCRTCVAVFRVKTKLCTSKRGRPRKEFSSQTPTITKQSSLPIEGECVASKQNKRRPVRQWDGEKWTTITSESPELHSSTIRQLQMTIATPTNLTSPSLQFINQVIYSTSSNESSNQIIDLLSSGEQSTKSCPKAPLSTTHSTLQPLPSIAQGIRPKKKKLPVFRSKQSYGFGPHAKAMYHINNRDHLKAFRSLMKTKAREAVTVFFAEVIARESKVLMKDRHGPLHQPLTEASVSGFPWDAVLAWGGEKAPLTLACLTAMLHKPSTRRNKSLRTEEVSENVIKQRLGLILAISLYTSMQECNFLQAFLGVEFLKQGCPPCVLNTLNTLGVCPSAASTQRYAESQNTVEVMEEPDNSFFGSECLTPSYPKKGPGSSRAHSGVRSCGKSNSPACSNERSLISQSSKNSEDGSGVERKTQVLQQMKVTENDPVHSPLLINEDTYMDVFQNKEPLDLSMPNIEHVLMSGGSETIRKANKMPKRGRPMKESVQVSETNVKNMQTIKTTCAHLEPAKNVRRGRPRKKPVIMAQETFGQNKPIQLINTDITPAVANKTLIQSVARIEKGGTDTTVMVRSMSSRKRQSHTPQVNDTELTKMPENGTDKVNETDTETFKRCRRRRTCEDLSNINRGRNRKRPVEMSLETDIHTEADSVPQVFKTNQQAVQGCDVKNETSDAQDLPGTRYVKQARREPVERLEDPIQIELMANSKKKWPIEERTQVSKTREETPSVPKLSKTVKEPALTRVIKIIVNRMEKSNAAQIQQISKMNKEPVLGSLKNVKPVQRSEWSSKEGHVQLNSVIMDPDLETTSTTKCLDKELVQRPQANKTNTELKQMSHTLEMKSEHIESATANKETCTDTEAAQMFKVKDKIKEDFQTRVIRLVDTRMRTNKDLVLGPQVNEQNRDSTTTTEIRNTTNQPTRVIRIVVNRRVADSLCIPARKGLECLAEVAATCAPLDVKSSNEDV